MGTTGSPVSLFSMASVHEAELEEQMEALTAELETAKSGYIDTKEKCNKLEAELEDNVSRRLREVNSSGEKRRSGRREGKAKGDRDRGTEEENTECPQGSEREGQGQGRPRETGKPSDSFRP